MFRFRGDSGESKRFPKLRKTRESPKKSLEAKESCYFALLWRASWETKNGWLVVVSEIFLLDFFNKKLGEMMNPFWVIFCSRGLQHTNWFLYEKLRVSFMIQFDAGNEGRFLRPIQSLKFVSVNFKFRKSNMKLCMKTLLGGLIPCTDYTDYSNILYNYLYVCIWYDTTSINIDLLCQQIWRILILTITDITVCFRSSI